MTRSVRTVPPTAPACEVARTFADHGIGSVLVVAADGDAPLGIVTQGDASGRGRGRSRDGRGGDAHVRAARHHQQGAEIHEAAAVMRDHSVRRLPVVDDEELAGILTTTDLTHYLPRLRNSILRERADADGR